jgi:hypothetical protein
MWSDQQTCEERHTKSDRKGHEDCLGQGCDSQAVD